MRTRAAVQARAAVVGICFVGAACAEYQPAGVETASVVISEPEADGTVMGVRLLVRGSVTEPNAKVMVLVHPLLTATWWVQGTVLTDPDGSWQINVHLGTETEGRGERFELVAIIPKRRKKEGAVVDEIPEHFARSSRVTIRRNR